MSKIKERLQIVGIFLLKTYVARFLVAFGTLALFWKKISNTLKSILPQKIIIPSIEIEIQWLLLSLFTLFFVTIVIIKIIKSIKRPYYWISDENFKWKTYKKPSLDYYFDETPHCIKHQIRLLSPWQSVVKYHVFQCPFDCPPIALEISEFSYLKNKTENIARAKADKHLKKRPILKLINFLKNKHRERRNPDGSN